LVSAEYIIFWVAVAFASWFIIGSIIGRRIMFRKVRSCVDNGGRLRFLTSSSALVEYNFEGFEYLGVFVDWVPFDNIINLPLKLIIRPRPLAIVKAQPRNAIQGYASLVARSRGEAVKGIYEVKSKNISQSRIARIVEAASKYGFEKVVIDVKPNVTVVTFLRGDCHSLVLAVRGFVNDLVGS
jgi:hypothetical protein